MSVTVWAGAAALTLYAIVSGVRGSAWTVALKDVMVLGVAAVLGIYLGKSRPNAASRKGHFSVVRL